MKHTQSKVEIKETVEVYEQICNLVTSDGRYSDLVAKIYPTVDGGEQEANAERFKALWNAADGKSNEDAVKALTHYEMMNKALKDIKMATGEDFIHKALVVLFAKLEAE